MSAASLPASGWRGRVGVALLGAANHRDRVLGTAGEGEPADPVAPAPLHDADLGEAVEDGLGFVLTDGEDPEVDAPLVFSMST